MIFWDIFPWCLISVCKGMDNILFWKEPLLENVKSGFPPPPTSEYYRFDMNIFDFFLQGKKYCG